MIISFLTLILVLSIALMFYVGRLVILLRSGQLMPQQLFGSDFVPSPDQNSQPALAASDDPHYGPPEAKVVIVEFSDFACSASRQVQPVVKEILQDYGDRIFFVWRDFPIIGDRQQSLLAAMAGECAHEQGKFWEMHDKIFASSEEITEASLKAYAVQIDLNNIQFSNCLGTGKYFAEIEQDFNDGRQYGVEATPTFFINGVKIPGAIPLATFEKIIVSELSR